MLTANNLGKKYKHIWALEPISLTLDRGMHGLLGPNGAGKSTLMRLLAGLIQPTIGDAWLQGASVRSGNHVRNKIGYVPQTFQMFPQLTARQWLLHVARLKNIGTKRERETETMRLLRSAHLEAEADLSVRRYSSGMIKRLGIAQALVGSPQIIIVDEPTAGLDPEERIRLRKVLVEIAQSSVVLFSTHVLSDVDVSCKDVIVLNAGKLHYNGNLTGLEKYAHNKLWEWKASEREWRALAHEQLITARRTEDGILCRVIADTPPSPYAVSVVPTMEDGYLALINSLKADSET